MRRLTAAGTTVVAVVVIASSMSRGGNAGALADAGHKPGTQPATAAAGKAARGKVTSAKASRKKPEKTPKPAVVAGSGEAAFLAAVVKDLGGDPTSADITSLEVWVTRESTWGQGARWNPLNSTLFKPGSTWFNSFGPNGDEHVLNYPSAEVGAEATAETLGNGNYTHIVAYLVDGTGLCQRVEASALAQDFRTWSGNGYSGLTCA